MIPGLVWGATARERAAALGCDAALPDARTRADRALSVAAPPSLVFAWLCQLRMAPYSYDLLDNLGRRSPRGRTPELVELAVGQRFMTVFELVSFVHGEHITLRSSGVAVTYAARADGTDARLVARVLFRAPPLVGRVLALGDLVMMRKQLRTLKTLAEREHRRS